MPIMAEDPGGSGGSTGNNTDVTMITLPALSNTQRYLVTAIHVQVASIGQAAIRLQESATDKMIWKSTVTNYLLDISGEIWVAARGSAISLVVDDDPDRTVTQLSITASIVNA